MIVLTPRLHGWLLAVLATVSVAIAAPKAPTKPWEPPALPDGQSVFTGSSPKLLQAPESLVLTELGGNLQVAKTAPTIDFLYFPGQLEEGRPWSAWGEGVVHHGRYYAAVGDHKLLTYIHEYDPATKQLRIVVDIPKLLQQPEGHYLPGKIHSRLGVGRDGWLYFTTHNGGGGIREKTVYKGDWVARWNLAEGKGEVLAEAPVGKLSIPVGLTDPERLIVYGGSDGELTFFAYDVASGHVVYRSPAGQGPTRCLLFSPSTGKVYYKPKGAEKMWRYDPATREATAIDCPIDPRAATPGESPDGFIYAIDWSGDLWRFDARSEQSVKVGHACLTKNVYTASMDMDSTGRYLYYVPGAHGSSPRDGTPILQYDLATNQRKVIAFLAPYLTEAVGFTPIGTYSIRISPDDATLFVTWMGDRPGFKHFDVCALTAIHVPAEERPVER